MATPYPETEPLFEEDPEFERLRRAYEREARRYYEHEAQRGWGDTTVCIGPDGPTALPPRTGRVATRSQS